MTETRNIAGTLSGKWRGSKRGNGRSHGYQKITEQGMIADSTLFSPVTLPI